MNELILEKIIKQSQFFALIAKAETRAISLAELVEDMRTYYAFTEVLWEKYLQESKFTLSNTILITRQREEIEALKKEVEKLNKVINL